jgi:glycosyltransferase involved in cell wall biosynthesis
MHILLFTDTFFPLLGGAEMVLHNLASQLQARGDRVTVLAPRIKGESDSRDRDYSYNLVRYGTPRSKRFFQRQLLVDLLRIHWRQRVDILHCHAAYPQAFVGASFKALTGVPMVVRPHGSDVVPGGRIRKNRRLERRLIRGLSRADAVVAQGRYLHQVISELGLSREKIKIINNGVDLGAFSEWNQYAHERPYMVAVGNLIHRKGFDLLLNAYARVQSPAWDLLIAGDGAERENLQQLARTRGIDDRVRFLGYVTGQEKVDLLRSAQCLVSASRKEPFSNVVLEAFACGLPVLASAVDGNLELVRDGETGYHFAPESEDALYQLLDSIMSSPQQLAVLRGNIETFVKSFDWPKVGERYRSLYQEVIG